MVQVISEEQEKMGGFRGGRGVVVVVVDLGAAEMVGVLDYLIRIFIIMQNLHFV